MKSLLITLLLIVFSICANSQTANKARGTKVYKDVNGTYRQLVDIDTKEIPYTKGEKYVDSKQVKHDIWRYKDKMFIYRTSKTGKKYKEYLKD